MLTCKQVSKALHKTDFQKMSPLQRFFLKLHTKLCVFCGKFNNGVIDSQEMCSCFKENEHILEKSRPTLDLKQKEALKESLLHFKE
jgi:hypothetical protein